MAGVCWTPVREARGKTVGGKLKSMNQVRAFVEHCDIEARLVNEHSNKHIDKSKTREVNGQFDGIDADRACEIVKDKLAELDAKPGANRRKDRVIAWGMCIYIPKEVKDVAQFTKDALHELITIVPEVEIVQAYLHQDEIHEYRDPETDQVKESMAHVHVLMVPVVDGMLNAYHFSTKANIVKYNNALDTLCVAKYGCHYMTGEGKKSKLTMRELKVKSDEAEIKAQRKALDASFERERAKFDAEKADFEAQKRDFELKKVEFDEKLSADAHESVSARLEAAEIRRSNASARAKIASEAQKAAKKLEEAEKVKRQAQAERDALKREREAFKAYTEACQRAILTMTSMYSDLSKEKRGQVADIIADVQLAGRECGIPDIIPTNYYNSSEDQARSDSVHTPLNRRRRDVE